jgi:hypothetical protein
VGCSLLSRSTTITRRRGECLPSFFSSLASTDVVDSVHIQGLESVVTRCYPKTDVSEEFRYECTQVLPVSVPLACTFRC